MKKALLFSGGRTSGFMLRKAIESGELTSDCIVAFCNTGKERTETLDFVHEVEIRWDVPIVWLEYHRVLAAEIRPGIFPTPRRNLNLQKAAGAGEFVHWFNRVDYQSASRNGEPFNELLEWMGPLPNPAARVCSTQLKLRSVQRFLFSIGVKEYAPTIGIRKDEAHRATEILASCESFEHPRFPLIDRGVTEADVMAFWKSNDFDLRLQSYEGNCDLCFLKAKWKLIRLIQENPGMSKWWKDQERQKRKTAKSTNGASFRPDRTYDDLEQIAANESRQGRLALPDPADVDIACSCAERAFGGSDE